MRQHCIPSRTIHAFHVTYALIPSIQDRGTYTYVSAFWIECLHADDQLISSIKVRTAEQRISRGPVLVAQRGNASYRLRAECRFSKPMDPGELTFQNFLPLSCEFFKTFPPSSDRAITVSTRQPIITGADPPRITASARPDATRGRRPGARDSPRALSAPASQYALALPVADRSTAEGECE